MLSSSLGDDDPELQMFCVTGGESAVPREPMDIEYGNELKRSHPTTDEDNSDRYVKKLSKTTLAKDRKKSTTNTSLTMPEVKEKSSGVSTQGASKTTLAAPLVQGIRNDSLANQESRKMKYDAYSKAPYIVHFRLIGNNQNKQMPLLNISKKLNSINIKFSHISR